MVTGNQIKIIIMCSVGIAGMLILLYSIIKKKKTLLVICVILTAVIELITYFAKIQTKSEHYAANITDGDISTYITIIGFENTIVDRTLIYVDEDDSVYNQLEIALTEEQINYDYSGSEAFSNIYIKSIAGLSEFDYGPTSGWTYTVNDEYPNTGCSLYELTDGDEVIWKYTESSEY